MHPEKLAENLYGGKWKIINPEDITEQKSKFIKILLDINYLLEGNQIDETKKFVNIWLNELRKD
jgi:hypothetical protein